jgi:hypothetical protein
MGFGRWPLRIVRGSGTDLYLFIDNETNEILYKFIDNSTSIDGIDNIFNKYKYLEYYIAGGGGAGSCRNGNSTISLNTIRYESYSHSIASTGNILIYCGGYTKRNTLPSSIANIYNISTGIWTKKKLSNARRLMAGAGINNKIVFAGGKSNNNFDVLNNVDIYDTVTSEWSSATLSVARYSISAIACNNKIFFAGGLDINTAASNVVDIYDTVTSEWSSATLSAARYSINSTSCDNKVFFAGGVSNYSLSTTSDIVDIYDTNTGIWSSIRLSLSRSYMGVASCGNKVFFAGGYNSPSITSTDIIDIYNTSSNTMTVSIYKLSLPCYELCAVSSDNRIYFAGGRYSSTGYNSIPLNMIDVYDITTDKFYNGTLSIGRTTFDGKNIGNKIMFFGGLTGGLNNNATITVTNSFEIIDPTDDISLFPKLSFKRLYPSAIYANNKIFIASGSYTNNAGTSVITGQIDVYDINTNNISKTTNDITQARAGFGITTIDNKIFFAGGYSFNPLKYHKTVNIYNITNNTWDTKDLSIARSELCAVAINNKVFFAGGSTTSGGATTYYKTIDIYNISTGLWSTRDLSGSRTFLAGASINNKVVFAGGYNASGSSKIVDIYDENTGLWNSTTLSVARSKLSVSAINNKIYFGGGSPGPGLQSSNVVDIYDTTDNSWSIIYLPTGKICISAAINNKIIFSGGQTRSSTYSYSIDIYNIDTNAWTTIPQPYNIIYSSIVAANNMIYFTGETGTIEKFNTITDKFENFNIKKIEDPLNIVVTQRSDISIGAIDNSVFFAGGYTGSASNTINIYNISTKTLVSKTLAVARYQLACCGLNGVIVFAGGNRGTSYTTPIPTDKIEAFDSNGNIVSTNNLNLSIARSSLAAAPAGNRIIFAGGNISNTSVPSPTRQGDYGIANSESDFNTYPINDLLRTARYSLEGVGIGNYAYFIGGRINNNTVTGNIDIIYGDDSTIENRTPISIPSLNIARSEFAAVAVGNKIYCAGGSTGLNTSVTDTIEVFDTETNVSTILDIKLSVARSNLGAALLGSKIIFVGGTKADNTVSDTIDIYNISTNTIITSIIDTATNTYIHGITLKNYAFFTTTKNSTDGIYPTIFIMNANDGISISNIDDIFSGGGGGGSGYQTGYLPEINSSNSKNYTISANPPTKTTKINLLENNIDRIDISLGNGANIGDLSGQPTLLRLKANGNTVFNISAAGGYSGIAGTNTTAGAGGNGFFGGGGGAGGFITDTASGGIGQTGYSGDSSTKSGTTYTSGAGARLDITYNGGSKTYTTTDLTKVAIGGGGGGGGGYLGNTNAVGAIHDILKNFISTASSGKDYTSQGGGGGAGTLDPGKGGKGFVILKFSEPTANKSIVTYSNPLMPQNFNVELRESSTIPYFNITWTNTESPTIYYIYYKLSSESIYTSITIYNNTTSYILDNLLYDNSYDIYIVSSINGRLSDKTETLTKIFYSYPIKPTYTFTYEDLGYTINWTGTVVSSQTYDIYYNETTSATDSIISNIPATTTSYNLTSYLSNKANSKTYKCSIKINNGPLSRIENIGPISGSPFADGGANLITIYGKPTISSVAQSSKTSSGITFTITATFLAGTTLLNSNGYKLYNNSTLVNSYNSRVIVLSSLTSYTTYNTYTASVTNNYNIETKFDITSFTTLVGISISTPTCTYVSNKFNVTYNTDDRRVNIDIYTSTSLNGTYILKQSYNLSQSIADDTITVDTINKKYIITPSISIPTSGYFKARYTYSLTNESGSLSTPGILYTK